MNGFKNQPRDFIKVAPRPKNDTPDFRSWPLGDFFDLHKRLRKPYHGRHETLMIDYLVYFYG